MMTKLLSISLACLFLLCGCATAYVDAIKKSSAPNWILLHENPKVGDYAVYESKDKEDGFRFEVVEVEKNLIHIRRSVTKAAYFESAAKNHVYNYKVRPSGDVVQAYLEALDSNERTPLSISRSGDSEYIKDPKSSFMDWDELIETKLGTYKVKKVLAYNTIARSSSGSTRFNYRFFLNPDVKFGYVRMHLVYVINFTEDRSAQAKLARQLDSDVGDMDTVATGIANLIAGGAHELVYNLIESN
jgi:hypothetical protein